MLLREAGLLRGLSFLLCQHRLQALAFLCLQPSYPGAARRPGQSTFNVWHHPPTLQVGNQR